MVTCASVEGFWAQGLHVLRPEVAAGSNKGGQLGEDQSKVKDVGELDSSDKNGGGENWGECIL